MITAHLDQLKHLYIVSKEHEYYISNKKYIEITNFKIIVNRTKKGRIPSVSIEECPTDEEFGYASALFFCKSYLIKMEYETPRYIKIRLILSSYVSYAKDVKLYMFSEYCGGHERLIRSFKILVSDFLYKVNRRYM